MVRLILGLLPFLGILMSLSPVMATTKEDHFWRWFQANEERLYTVERSRGAIVTDLMRELEKVDEYLSFMVEPPDKHGRRKFILSADGYLESFPAVEALHAAAPPLPRWIIVKFRQRNTLDGGMVVSLVNGEAQKGEMRYEMSASKGKANIRLFLPGAERMSDDANNHVARLHLMDFLGEEDFGRLVAEVTVSDVTHPDYDRSTPIAELPNQFDATFKN